MSKKGVLVLAGCSGQLVSTAEPSSTPLVPSAVPSEPGILKKTLTSEQTSQPRGTTMRTVNIQVGNKNFTAILYDNDSTQALIAKLPLTLNIDELNGNEKILLFFGKIPYQQRTGGKYQYRRFNALWF